MKLLPRYAESLIIPIEDVTSTFDAKRFHKPNATLDQAIREVNNMHAELKAQQQKQAAVEKLSREMGEVLGQLTKWYMFGGF